MSESRRTWRRATGQPRRVPYAAVEEVLLEQKASLRRDPEKAAREKEAAERATLEAGKITGLYFPSGALVGAAPRL